MAHPGRSHSTHVQRAAAWGNATAPKLRKGFNICAMKDTVTDDTSIGCCEVISCNDVGAVLKSVAKHTWGCPEYQETHLSASSRACPFLKFKSGSWSVVQYLSLQ